MHKKELSIVIPCYNCSGTLEEAVDSCFRQGLEDFEIVMVDDHSTDETPAVMQKLAEKHPEIRIFRHDTNRGGGAARNTAVSHAQSDVVFCLDSDDMLGDGTLSKMLSYLREKKCDGVGISTSIKFKGKDTNDIAFTHRFDRVGEKILFEDLFEKEPRCSLYSVFMFTRAAFEATGGYPTDHGFDTQGFAFRFLANGLVAYTCPDTTYLHRIGYHRSYYIREYEAGKINHNWIKIYEEFLYLFNEAAQREILGFDVAGSSKALNVRMNEIGDIFVKDYKSLIGTETKERYAERLSRSTKTAYDFYWLGIESLRSGKHKEALSNLTSSLESGLAFPVAFARAAEALGMASGKTPLEIADAVRSFYSYTLRGSRVSLPKRAWRKLKKSLNL